MDNSDINKFIHQAKDAIRHYDDTATVQLLREAERLMSDGSISKNDQRLFEDFQKLIIHLKIVSLPKLSDEEAAEVIKNHYLDSFDIEIDMENRLTLKLFLAPYFGPRDEVRKKLKNAILENQQLLGQLTISQWIAEFEKQYPEKTRIQSATVEFSASNRNAALLNTMEKERLKEILHTYDYMLVTTLPSTGPALDQILNAPLTDMGTLSTDQPKMPAYISPEVSFKDDNSVHNTRMLFNDALKKISRDRRTVDHFPIYKVKNVSRTHPAQHQELAF